MIQSARIALLEGRLDDVRIGQPACGRDPIDRDVPEIRELLAMGRVLELAIARHATR